MPIGTCRLCLTPNVELRDSHFIPAGFYKAARKADGSNEDLTIVTREVVIQTSEQAQQPLLCTECEDRFNKFGEKWTLANACLANRTFPLLDRLRAIKPSGSAAKSATYFADDVPGVRHDQLAYFGASIFWRAATTEWHLVSSAPKLQLGPYEEALRLYLLNKAGWPKGAVLAVSVDGSDQPLVAHMGEFPHIQNRTKDYRHFSFTVNSLRFDLVLGRSIPAHIRGMCIVNAPRHPIFVLEHIGKLLMESFGKMRRGAKPVGKLAKS